MTFRQRKEVAGHNLLWPDHHGLWLAVPHARACALPITERVRFVDRPRIRLGSCCR